MKTLLITGGSGFLGRAVQRAALLSGGWSVTIASRAAEPANPAVRALPLDVVSDGSVAACFAAAAPQYVIHAAYRQDGADAHEITALGAERVARAAAAFGARLLHLSTDVLFDGESPRPYREDDPPAPLHAYGAAKATAERLVASACPSAAIVRTSLLYSAAKNCPRQRAVLDAIDRGQPFFTDEIRCPIDVEALAAALLELALLPYAGPLHLAGADAVSRLEFAQLIAKAHGVAAQTVKSALSRDSGLPRPRNCALDCSRAKSLLRAPLPGVRSTFAL